MSRSRRWKVVAVLLGVGAIVSVAGLRLSMERGKGWRLGWRAPWPIRRATPVAEVATHKLRRTLVDQGRVWIDWNNEVQSPYEGDFTIIKLVAEGTKVKKGDIVCELDSTGLQEQLNKRIIVARKAETDFRNLKLAREAIEVALAKLVQGKSPAQDCDDPLGWSGSSSKRSRMSSPPGRPGTSRRAGFGNVASKLPAASSMLRPMDRSFGPRIRIRKRDDFVSRKARPSGIGSGFSAFST